jgi:hypothetical protein
MLTEAREKSAPAEEGRAQALPGQRRPFQRVEHVLDPINPSSVSPVDFQFCG